MKDNEAIAQYDTISEALTKSEFNFAQMAHVWNYFLWKLAPYQKDMVMEHSRKKVIATILKSDITMEEFQAKMQAKMMEFKNNG